MIHWSLVLALFLHSGSASSVALVTPLIEFLLLLPVVVLLVSPVVDPFVVRLGVLPVLTLVV